MRPTFKYTPSFKKPWKTYLVWIDQKTFLVRDTHTELLFFYLFEAFKCPFSKSDALSIPLYIIIITSITFC